MMKVFNVAWREFVATVATKGFILGVFLPPVLIGIVLAIMPMLMNQAAPRVTGRVAIIDHTGDVASRVKDAFSAERIASRAAGQAMEALEEAGAPDMAKQAAAMGKDSIEQQAKTNAPTLTVEVLDPSTSVEEAKAELLAAEGKGKGEGNPRLALAVIPADAIKADAQGKFGSFELFAAPKLDGEVQGDIRSQIGSAVVDARIKAGGFDPAFIRSLTERPRPQVRTVTAQGDQKIDEAAKILIPAAFMFLLWISTFTCGQYLLTSTIEEKSSRVMEVILSAVSPMQLLTGKILGQMCVGLVILVVYCGLGMAGLVVASMMSVIDPINLVYLAVYFVIAFFIIASLMAAVGSAVSDVREAQSLLGPVMIILIIPMMLWLPILRNPNSTFAQVCSFIPPISPFVMVLRLSGSEPVPFWQVIATVLLGGVTILTCLWAAGKVFRVGVLMYGKPPDLRTLIRWIRMA